MSIPRTIVGGGWPHGRSCGRTDVGLVRDHNEDAFFADDRRGVWAVADGMGGHEAGDHASQVVVEHVRHIRTQWPTPRALVDDIAQRLSEANVALRRHAAEAGLGVIGATVVALAAYEGHALIAWSGDSRAYRLRPGRPMRRITRDHTMVQGLVDQGRLSEAEAEEHPSAHMLTRAVGAADSLAVDFEQLDLAAGDRFLLCSDGLTRPVLETAIAEALAGRAAPEEVADGLIRSARDNGAPDNVTVVVIDFS